jgi:hypothetical protein
MLLYIPGYSSPRGAGRYLFGGDSVPRANVAPIIAKWQQIFLLFCISCASGGNALAGSAPVIPRQFRGEWNQDTRGCGTDLNDSRLIIRAHTLAFYESDGEVKSIIRHNPLSITLTATFAGEGEVWNASDQLVLSRSGDTLTVNTGGTSMNRYRCPAHKRK